MSSIMLEQQQEYAGLMDRASTAIRDRNEDVLSTLTAESERIIHAMQRAWSDVLARVEACPSHSDREGEIRRLTQSVEQSLDKAHNTQHALAQWRREIGTSLGVVNQGRIAVRGYAIGKGK